MTKAIAEILEYHRRMAEVERDPDFKAFHERAVIALFRYSQPADVRAVLLDAATKAEVGDYFDCGFLVARWLRSIADAPPISSDVDGGQVKPSEPVQPSND